jgi:hypothetical protein
LWTGRLDIVKMPLLSKLMDRFNAVFFKIPIEFFCKYRQIYSKTYTGKQGIRRTYTILGKKIKKLKWQDSVYLRRLSMDLQSVV